jgi:hypothetical protein
MRDATKRLGGDPAKINPGVPVDLVVDHSVQVKLILSTKPPQGRLLWKERLFEDQLGTRTPQK